MPYSEVMDEISKAGYEGTELGPYGYFPTDADVLRPELEKRDLELASSFVPVALAHPDKVGEALETVLQVGALLRQFGVREVIVADHGTPQRAKVAGFVSPDGSDGWNDKEWQQAGKTMDVIARACRDKLGMRVVFHNHVGTFVETPEEVDRLMAITDPELVGLCLDTGHYAYGGGDCVEVGRKYADRIWYVHLKDVWGDKLEKVRRERITAHEAWGMGVFAEIGRGCVDFPGFMDVLLSKGYEGWLIVEQDVIKSSDPAGPWTSLASAIESREYIRNTLGL